MSDLVVISLEAWDAVWRRNQHIIAGLLSSNAALRVLFVEPPADPAHDLRSGRRPGFGRSAVAVEKIAPGRLWAVRPVKWLPRRLDARADVRLARAVMRTAAGLGMAHPVLWINDPGAAALAALSGWPTLYDITDDWLDAARSEDERERLSTSEAYLLDTAREVVVCSPELARRKGANRPVTLIPNAVDVARYRRPTARPSDLPSTPVALYLGTVHPDRIDVDLCEATARALGHDGTLTLVGPDLLAPQDASRLRRAGALILGSRGREDVVGYLQHADVLVVPHVVTAFTDSLDPIKLYEYQAVGRPVVATSVAGFRDVVDPRVTLADGNDFPSAVAAALRESAPFPTGAEGAVPDWSERVAAMGAVLGRMGER